MVEGVGALDMHQAEAAGAGGPEVFLCVGLRDQGVVSLTSDKRVGVEALEGLLALGIEGCMTVGAELRACLLEATRRKMIVAAGGH